MRTWISGVLMRLSFMWIGAVGFGSFATDLEEWNRTIWVVSLVLMVGLVSPLLEWWYISAKAKASVKAAE